VFFIIILFFFGKKSLKRFEFVLNDFFSGVMFAAQHLYNKADVKIIFNFFYGVYNVVQ